MEEVLGSTEQSANHETRSDDGIGKTEGTVDDSEEAIRIEKGDEDSGKKKKTRNDKKKNDSFDSSSLREWHAFLYANEITFLSWFPSEVLLGSIIFHAGDCLRGLTVLHILHDTTL